MTVVALETPRVARSNADIAGCLRLDADQIEAGAPVRQVILVVEDAEGQLSVNVAGEHCDLARTVGLLTMAAMRKQDGSI